MTPPLKHWNYRVMQFEQGKETWRAIHEVYYERGVHRSYAERPAPVIAYEGERVLDHIKMMLEALLLPVLTPADFPEPSKLAALGGGPYYEGGQ